MASLPLFFYDAPLEPQAEVWSDEDTAKHVIQVLRMRSGDRLQFTDGKGHVATATIVQVQKKKFSVSIDEVHYTTRHSAHFHLCVAFTKNNSRNEWLLEKITEMGVTSITPLLTSRTERERIRYDRWSNILVSALLQSQQYYLPVLNEAMPLAAALDKYAHCSQKLLAHCMSEKERIPVAGAMQPHKETLILIGPEGDFTPEEVDLCEAQGCTGVSLSNNRLRTETAAMACCAYFNLLNHA